MKAVLSYHHAIQHSSSRLRDTDYMLVVPFVYVQTPHISRSVTMTERVTNKINILPFYEITVVTIPQFATINVLQRMTNEMLRRLSVLCVFMLKQP